MSLANLKKQYSILQKKYKLPKFSDLNADFEIEKLQDKETEHLMRSMRRVMVERIANIVRFLELTINPSEGPTPMFMYAMLKTIKSETKDNIEILYKELSKWEIKSLSLDIVHNEKEEVNFLKELYKNWESWKPKLLDITKKMSMSWSKGKKPEHGYLG